MKRKFQLACLIVAISFAANAADTLKTTAPVEPPAVAPKPPARPAAPASPKAVKAPTAAKAQVTAPKINAVATPTAPQVEKPAAPQVDAKPNETTLKQLNKKHLLDFLRASTSGDVAAFYRANPQFANSMSEKQFVAKFGKYSDLPNDIAALEAHDFAGTTITSIANNKKYKGCQLVEAKSEVKLQVVQASHDYKLTNRYCLKEGEYKLVSFRLGYEE